MIEEICEPIKVLASFSAGKMMPYFFSWRKRRYRVAEVTGWWSDYEGEAKRFFFSVLTDGVDLYEISFHTRTLNWELLRIHHA